MAVKDSVQFISITPDTCCGIIVFMKLCIFLMLSVLISCGKQGVIEGLYPSQGVLGENSLTLMTDDQNEVVFLDETQLYVLHVAAQQDEPVYMVIQIARTADQLTLTGYDLRGYYSSFVISGDPEELFGGDEDIQYREVLLEPKSEP